MRWLSTTRWFRSACSRPGAIRGARPASRGSSAARAVKRARIQLLVLVPIGIASLRPLQAPRAALRRRHAGARRSPRSSCWRIGWQLARDVGRSVGPALFRRHGSRHRRALSASCIRLADDPLRASSSRCGSRGWTRGRWPSAARSPRSSSVSPPSRRSAT